MPFWLKEFSTGYTDPATGMPAVTSSQTSEIVSILSAGTFFGALASAFFGDFFGRRMGLIYSNFVFILGVILQTAATHIPTFVAGRFFAGFGVGLVSALIPLYQSESAPKWIRGLIVGAYQWAITIGLFLAAIVNNSTHLRNDTGSYRIPIAVQFAWSLILITGLLFLPETPRYHIKRGRNEQAAKSLSRLRRVDVDHPALVEELAEIQANHEYEMSLGNASYLDCFKGNLGRRLLTGCLLQSLQQLTGVNFIFYYGTKFFTQRNLAAPFITTVITNVVNVVGTLPGLIGVEMFGRRPLLFWGAIGMLVCQFIAAAVGDNLNTGASNKAFVAFICIYVCSFPTSSIPSVPSAFHNLLTPSTDLLLRLHLGPHSLGRNRRDLPLEGTRKMPLHDHGLELAPQLGHRLRDALPRRPGPRQRQPAVQSLLPLGQLLRRLRRVRVVHDLRDQGLVAGAGRRALCQSAGCVEIDGLCAHG